MASFCLTWFRNSRIPNFHWSSIRERCPKSRNCTMKNCQTFHPFLKKMSAKTRCLQYGMALSKKSFLLSRLVVGKKELSKTFSEPHKMVEHRHYRHFSMISEYVWAKFKKLTIMKWNTVKRGLGYRKITKKMYALLSWKV